MEINKNVEIDIPCPDCGYKRKFTLKELENNPQYICENCKKTVNLKGDKFIKDIESNMNRAENELRDTIKRLNTKNK